MSGLSPAELKAAHKRLLTELLLEQAAPPTRSHRNEPDPADSPVYGLPVTKAQADRNWAVLAAAISTPRHHEDDDTEETG